MIGVMGPTGQVGVPLMAALEAEGVPVRALAHTSVSAEKLTGDNVEVVIGDIRNAGDLRRFLEGVSSLFLLTPPSLDQVEVQNNIVDAAVEAGVASIVKLSVYTAADNSPCGFSRWHIVNDRYIAESGLAYTILHPHSFMQSMAVQFADGIRTAEVMEAAVRPDAKITMIDARDVGEVAARVLVDYKHEGETILITGPEEVSYPDCAALIGKAIGKDIEYRQLTNQEAHNKFTSQGVPDWFADSLVGLHSMYDTGLLNPRTDTIRRFTGKPGRSFADYVADHAELYR